MKVKFFFYSYLLTPWSRVLLEKLTGSAASREIPRIFGSRRFITVLTSARHLSLSWANSIQSSQPPPILLLSSHLQIIIIIIIIIIMLLLSILSQASSSRYFSRTNNDTRRSGYKFQTAVLDVLRVMFQVQLSFVANLLNIFLVWLPNFSWKPLLLFGWLHLLPVREKVLQ